MIDPEHGQELWAVLRIGGKRSPGVVRVSGNDLVIGWDVQNATGTAGATTKRTGEPLKKFEAEFDLSNEADEYGFTDFDRWDEFQELLESTVAGSKPIALDVYHPDLARNHITAVTLGSISGMSLDGRGGGKIKVSFLEYRPPKPAKTNGATKSAPKTAGDQQIDAATAQIKALQEEWKTL